MALKTEEMHAGEFLVSEAEPWRSREQITVASGQDLKAGHVVGRITASSTSVTADSGNTGDGSLTNVATQAGVKPGDYRVTIIEPATDGGKFTVEDPDGIEVGTGAVGTTFSGGGIQFDLNDGASDFVAGDTFTINVSGTGEYKEYDPANTDGSGTAAGVLYAPVDASAGAEKGVVIRRDAEIDRDQLTWFSNATAAQIETGLAELEDQGIIAR